MSRSIHPGFITVRRDFSGNRRRQSLCIFFVRVLLLLRVISECSLFVRVTAFSREKDFHFCVLRTRPDENPGVFALDSVTYTGRDNIVFRCGILQPTANVVWARKLLSVRRESGARYLAKNRINNAAILVDRGCSIISHFIVPATCTSSADHLTYLARARSRPRAPRLRGL